MTWSERSNVTAIVYFVELWRISGFNCVIMARRRHPNQGEWIELDLKASNVMLVILATKELYKSLTHAKRRRF